MQQYRPVRIENSKLCQSHFLNSELEGCRKHPEAVFHATLKTDRRGFGKILSWARNLADPIIEVNCLSEHLVIEQKVVAIFFERYGLEHLAREGAKSGMILRQLITKQQILNG